MREPEAIFIRVNRPKGRRRSATATQFVAAWIAATCLFGGNADCAEAVAPPSPLPAAAHTKELADRAMVDLAADLSTAAINASILSAIADHRPGVRLAPQTSYRLVVTPHAALDGTAAALTIKNATDFILDCRGAELALTGGKSGYGHILRIEYGSRVTIKNCDLDYVKPPFLQATLVAVRDQEAIFKVDDDEVVFWSAIQRVTAFDRATGLWMGTNLEWNPGSAASPVERPITRTSTGAYDVHYGRSDLAALAALKVGTSYLIQDQVYGANGISWYGVNGLTVDNTHVFAAAGQGFTGQASSDVRFINGSGVRIKPGTGRVASTNADGINVADQRGLFSVDAGVFEGSQDDAINVYGFQVPIQSIQSTTVLTLTGTPTAWHDGDMLEFVDASGRLRGTAEAVAFSFQDGRTVVTLRSPAPPGVSTDWVTANQTDAPTLLSVHDSSFSRLRGRAIVANAKKIDIIGNTFTDLPSNGAMTFASNFSYFAQGPVPRSIRIENNWLKRINTLGSDPGAIQVYAFSKDGSNSAPAGQIESVSIIGNTIEDTSGMCVFASGVSHLHIAHNTASHWASSSTDAAFHGLGRTCYGLWNSSGSVGANTFLTPGAPRSSAIGASAIDVDAQSR